MRALDSSRETQADHCMPAPEEISLQGIPRMGVVLREIGLCIAIALGLALLAMLYAHFIKGG
jgi:hypothetical protein